MLPMLQSVTTTTTEHPPLQMFLRLVLAFGLGSIIAFIYRRVPRKEPPTPTFSPTLVLLTILITAVTLVIGDSVARAFSLVGALSIVRFRTVVQDTQDTAFVIFAVIVGMAVGASHLWAALICLVVVGTAVFLSQPRKRKPAPPVDHRDYRLGMRLRRGVSPEGLLTGLGPEHLDTFETLNISTVKEAELETRHHIRLTSTASPADFVEALRQQEGVLQVEIRRQ